MAETYIVGETKVRPGAYFNIQKTGNNAAASIISGVTAVIFKSDFGPLNQAVELNAEDGYADTFGTGGTTDAMQEAINGGARPSLPAKEVMLSPINISEPTRLGMDSYAGLSFEKKTRGTGVTRARCLT